MFAGSSTELLPEDGTGPLISVVTMPTRGGPSQEGITVPFGPTLRLGQDVAFPLRHPLRASPEQIFYRAVAAAISIVTPAPIVELSEILVR